MTDQAPNPAPAASAAKPVDWDNVAAFLVAGAMAFGIMYFKPDGAALATASSVVGGCLLYIKGR